MRKRGTKTVSEVIVDPQKEGVDFGELVMTPFSPFHMNPVSPGTSPDGTSPAVDYDDPWSDSIPLGVYRVFEDGMLPSYSSDGGACFTLRAYLGSGVMCVDTHNRLLMHNVRSISPILERDSERGVRIEPGECVYIPTGLVFDIPEGYVLSIYPRKAMSGKKHLRLANCTDIIEATDKRPVVVLIYNDSQERQSIIHNEQIAVAEIRTAYRASFFEMRTQPECN
jgi:dUTPase